jgi:hypothetical protein
VNNNEIQHICVEARHNETHWKLHKLGRLKKWTNF